jgi:hypothetical protein
MQRASSHRRIRELQQQRELNELTRAGLRVASIIFGPRSRIASATEDYMEEQLRKLNAEYGFKLTEEEIKVIALQADEANRLFQPLFEVDLDHVMPVLKLDRRAASRKPAKKERQK